MLLLCCLEVVLHVKLFFSLTFLYDQQFVFALISYVENGFGLKYHTIFDEMFFLCVRACVIISLF